MINFNKKFKCFALIFIYIRYFICFLDQYRALINITDSASKMIKLGANIEVS